MRKWQGKWIDPEIERPWLEIVPIEGQEDNPNPAARIRKIEHRKGASYLRKIFSVEPPDFLGEKVILYATAHGIYDVWINDVHVEGYCFAPGTSQYDKRLKVQSYDITSLLQNGENEIRVSCCPANYLELPQSH